MPALLITAFLSTEAGSARSRVFRADCNKREEMFASSPQLPSTPSFPFSFLVHSRQQSLAIRDRRSFGLTEGNRSRRRRRRDTGILLSTSWPGKIMAITSTTLLGGASGPLPFRWGCKHGGGVKVSSGRISAMNLISFEIVEGGWGELERHHSRATQVAACHQVSEC